MDGSRFITPVAAVVFDRDVEIDALIATAVAELRRRGVAVGGLLQQFGERLPNGKRSLWLEEIGSGQRLRLDRPRGVGAIGCTFDPDALARAACVLRDTMRSGVDLLVVNRFGVSEASGSGMRAEIAEAVSAGTPVLVAVRKDLRPDWEGFVGAPACCLPPSLVAILAWAEAAMAVPRQRDQAATAATA